MENNTSTPPSLPEPTKKSNGCGIAACCVGLFVPIAGVVLAIIALNRGEPNKSIGKAGLWISIGAWIVNIMILMASNS